MIGERWRAEGLSESPIRGSLWGSTIALAIHSLDLFASLIGRLMAPIEFRAWWAVPTLQLSIRLIASYN